MYCKRELVPIEHFSLMFLTREQAQHIYELVIEDEGNKELNDPIYRMLRDALTKKD